MLSTVFLANELRMIVHMLKHQRSRPDGHSADAKACRDDVDPAVVAKFSDALLDLPNHILCRKKGSSA